MRVYGRPFALWAIVTALLFYWFFRLAIKVPEELERLNTIKIIKPKLYRVELGAYLFVWAICLFLMLIVIGPYFYIKYFYR